MKQIYQVRGITRPNKELTSNDFKTQYFDRKSPVACILRTKLTEMSVCIH